MRRITKEEFVKAVKNLLIQTHYFLPEDVLESIKNSICEEKSEIAKDVLYKILENAHIASITGLPLCQDTGIPQFFLKVGKNLCFNFDLYTALDEVVQEVYEEENLRKSCVEDPLRRNRQRHCFTLYIEHTDEEEKCKIYILIRGGGSENTFATTTFLPTTDFSEIIYWIIGVVVKMLPYTCPPAVVGIGIGGSAEQSIILAKKSFLRKINERNKDYFYSELEKQIKERINNSAIGPLGLGGQTSILDVFIETSPTHIATLPVSVVLQCHSYRRGVIVI